MSVRSTKGLKIYMSKGLAPNGIVTSTAITNTAPAVVTVDDATGLVNGQPISVSGTGMTSLDGKTFVVAELDGGANEFTLLGSDASAEAAPGTAGNFAYFSGTDLTLLCLAEIGINQETPGAVAIGTFCNPSQSVPATVVAAGTIDLRGYMDTQDAGYAALIAAEADGENRILEIQFPGDGGYLIAQGVISAMGLSDIPIDGAAAYTAQLTLSTKPVHLF